MTDDRTPTSDRERPGRPERPLERPSSADTHGSDQRPLVSFDSRLPKVDRSPLVPVIALSLLVALAVVTSRAAVPGASPDSSGDLRLGAASDRSGGPSVAPSDPADQAVGAICLEPGSWRSATIETWRDQTVHVWRAVHPAAASGPADPTIQLVPAVGSRIAAIGFCAPVVGPDRPVGDATVEGWWTSETDRANLDVTRAPVAIDLRPLVPTTSQSAFGGLYGPPEAIDAGSGWPAGIVIFRYGQTSDGAPSTAVWFGIEIALTDASGAEASPEVKPSAGSVVPARSPGS